MPFPVYIELKLFSPSTPLTASVANQLGLPVGSTEKYLKEGRLSLFLDGLNEVSIGQRNEAIRNIQSLLNDYPDAPVIVTSRNHYIFQSNQEEQLPQFELREMDDEQLKLFFAKNGSPQVNALFNIEKEIEQAEGSNFLNWLRVPMLFKMLLSMAEDICEKFPEPEPQDKRMAVFEERTQTQLSVIEYFINGIFEREQGRDSGFNPIAFETLLKDLAVHLWDSNEQHGSIRTSEAVDFLREAIKNGFPNTDVSYFLDKSVELRILKKDGMLYSFAHEEYFNYFNGLKSRR
ncbi:NACHT domain-containing protein [Thioflexithrix psekupsensis]|uniref:Uncharacterized protein n=1 Tax=Thioflexithrix psekupsensis TaxID=1570016 RepID=A0A251XCK5_9GAMM|nr:hypothetical protein [Thioflexithrix psekupsensis]OUD16029.1 hypothetical protein TPSD3_01095 [Thioflexithrix psekupsensis]